MKEEDLAHDIAIFPNPTNGIAMIEVSGYVGNEASLVIYDMMGRPVHNAAMNATGTFAEAQVDLSYLPSGNYIVKIITKDQVYTKELIKK